MLFLKTSIRSSGQTFLFSFGQPVCDSSVPTYNEFPYGLAVRIPGFHPGGPGSTPGMGKCFHFIFKALLIEIPSEKPLDGDNKRRQKLFLIFVPF